MKLDSPKLIVEISDKNYIFIVVNSEDEKFKMVHKNEVIRSENKSIIDNFEYEKETVKKNIYSIEQKLGLTFKEVIIIVDNLNCSIINISGFKRLSGSQLTRENITYILNSLKFIINESEKKKEIIHIFNSKYILDKKKVTNLPIGLFGDFYSQELSCFLINKNFLKNLKSIFSQCNLKVNKVISKSFVEGANLINNKNLEHFVKIKLNKDDAQLIFFENSSLKFFQDFNFGTNTIISDISKVTGIEKKIVEKILDENDLNNKASKDQFIDRNYFKNKNFRKISKRLFIDIANARISEIAEIIFLKNINMNFLEYKIPIFLNISDELQRKNFLKNYELNFSDKKKFNIEISENYENEFFFASLINLVQYGWKREAVPIIQEKKSFIARFFNLFFD